MNRGQRGHLHPHTLPFPDSPSLKTPRTSLTSRSCFCELVGGSEGPQCLYNLLDSGEAAFQLRLAPGLLGKKPRVSEEVPGSSALPLCPLSTCRINKHTAPLQEQGNP